MERAVTAEMEKPPVTELGIMGWIWKNLFGSWLNTLLTLISGAFLFVLGRAVLTWAVREANWRAVTNNLRVLAWGRYPDDQVWRLGASAGFLLLLALVTWLVWRGGEEARARRYVLGGWLLSPVVLTVLICGIRLPTLNTIGNNFGYYLFRPDVLISLDEAWRATMGLAIVGLLSAASLHLISARRWRVAVIAAMALAAGLTLPLGLQAQPWILGLTAPLLLRFALAMGIGYWSGAAIARALQGNARVLQALPTLWAVVVVALIVLLTNFEVGVPRVDPVEALPIVQPSIWSGIMLTLALATVSIAVSFPIGILLALGRRSSLPVVKGLCILTIEVIRGVPLITILFMAQVMLPLFLPLEFNVDRVLRAMVGMTIFTAAYLAEIVRGGLQAVRHEQVEAARSLGLSEVLVTGLIVLPQALRAVIPPIMGQFVSIFKDTSLVAIVGLLDLLAVGQSVIKAREYLGAVREMYLFAGVFYFVVSYGMSLASRRIEKRLGVVES